MFAEQFAVDVWKRGERFVEVGLAFLRRRVEDLKQVREVLSQVRAVGSGAVFDEEAERFTFKDAGVLGKQTKEDANEKLFEVMAGVAARFERIVKLAEKFSGFDVDRVLLLVGMLFVAGNESEVLHVPVKLGEREFVGDPALFVEQRQVALFLRLQIVQRDAREI